MRSNSEVPYSGICIFLIIILVTLVFATQPDEIVTDEVNIQPGGQVHTFQKTIPGGVTCKFTYSAQGGTNERWYLQMSHSRDTTQFGCSVHRPESMSYLFFMTFKLEISGANIIHASANGNKGPLKPEEFVVDLKKNTVSHVENKFQSQLTQVALQAQKGKSEL